MEVYQNKNTCCVEEQNIIETDDGYVCTVCAKVQDNQCFRHFPEFLEERTEKPELGEYCHRLNIEKSTQYAASKIYDEALSSNLSLKRTLLLATSIYIATKKNCIPRTLREISLVTGESVKKIGECEKIISKHHYHTIPTDYLYRFGHELNLPYKQIREIEEDILNHSSSLKIQNPVLVCGIYLYKHTKNCQINPDLLQQVTGIPISTLKLHYRRNPSM